MIVELSSPSSASVNDGISEELCSIKYASLEDAVRLLKQLGRGTQLVKLDLCDAYRIIPVHPEDQHLLAIEWQGMTFVDKALPFGLRSAPKVFSAVNIGRTVPVIKYCTRCNKQFLAQVEDSICDLPDGSAIAYCDPTVLCPLYDDNQFGWYLNERFMNLSDI